MSPEEKLENILTAFSMFLGGGLTLTQLRNYINKIHPVDLSAARIQQILIEARNS